MRDLLRSFSLLDVSGLFIIGVIVSLLLAGVVLTVVIHGRYARIARDLREHAEVNAAFESRVLDRAARETIEALQRHPSDVNTQVIVDTCFQAEHKGLLVGERFVRSLTGLLIILGLVGTFYGLTLSIGKLVSLVSGTTGSATDVTASLTRGLTEALGGMSVAFSCSLFGILAAIVMTLLGVFANVGDRRTALMLQVEAYLDNVLLAAARRAQGGVQGGVAGLGIERALGGFDQSVARLDQAVRTFEQALATFSSSTRDFHEFNHHLRDNIQRMSLSFGDLSEVLQREVHAMRSRDRS